MKQSTKSVGKYIMLARNTDETREIISTLLVDIMLRRRIDYFLPSAFKA